MSDVPERGAAPADSLAAQAAAWVPPWARQAPADAEPTDLPEPAESSSTEAAEAAEPAEDAEAGAPAEPWELVDASEPGEALEAVGPVAAAEPAEESADKPEFVAPETVEPAAHDELASFGATDDDEPVVADEPGLVAADQTEAEPFAADEAEAEPVGQDDREPEPVSIDEVGADQFAATVFGDEAVSPAEAAASALIENLPPVPAVELRPALEAILLVVDEPVTELLLAQVLEQPVDAVAAELVALAAEYTEQGRGFELRRAAGGWRLYTRPEYAAHVERFVLDGQSVRLTQAALETLAVVAYKQPVTRSRISAIRGVNCDGVVRTLVTRGLIEESGTEPESGAYLYRTSNLFLEKLGLDSVDQLPPLAPFLPDNVDEIAGDVGR